jgi:hypothetical protein
MDETAVKPQMTAYMKLRRRTQRFIDEYIIDGIGAAAMRRIGYQGAYPEAAAWRLLKLPGVREAIEERKAEAIARDGDHLASVVRCLRIRAKADPRMLLDEKGNPRPLQDLPDELALAIAGVEVEEIALEGVVIGRIKKYRLSNANEAAKLWLQFHGALKERLEHTGKDGAPLRSGPVYVISKEEAGKIGEELDAAV